MIVKMKCKNLQYHK